MILRLEYSIISGHVIRMIRKDIQLSINMEQEFFWYEGSVGNKASRQTSGAYVFRPNSSEPSQVCKGNIAKIEVIKGGLVQELRQTFGTFVSQVIRLYKDADYAEFEYTVGPIPIKDNLGKEIITKFKTSINNGDVFYTDANGREIKKRIRDYRETWKFDNKEPVAGNYFPVNSRIFINDSVSQFTIMSDRSHGGGSIKNGELEMMLHRRLLKDDFLGVGEALNETGADGRGLITRGKHRIILSTVKEGSRLHRYHAQQMMMDPILSFAYNPYTIDDWHERFYTSYSALSKLLPENVHVLTMETSGQKDRLILRFEHLFAIDEDPVFSRPVTINLKGLFKDFNILDITEMNLSANQLLREKKMMNWNISETRSNNYRLNRHSNETPFEIELKPMEIRTFIAIITWTK